MRVPVLPRIDAQIQVAPLALRRDETLAVARHSANRQGLESSESCEPYREIASVKLLKRLLHPMQRLVEPLRGALKVWGLEHQTYNDRTGETPNAPVRRRTPLLSQR